MPKLVKTVHLTATNTYETKMLKSVFSSMFFGLFRIGEVALSVHTIKLGNVTRVNWGYHVGLKTTKNNRTAEFTQSAKLEYSPSKTICPVPSLTSTCQSDQKQN